jgi:hypothetical protein
MVEAGWITGVDLRSLRPHYLVDMASVRYRCAACGNLTRFDVVAERKTKAFHHYSVGGELLVEDEQLISEKIVEVSCRWCGHGNAIETLQDVSSGS